MNLKIDFKIYKTDIHCWSTELFITVEQKRLIHSCRNNMMPSCTYLA